MQTPRKLADAYVEQLTELDPLISSALGLKPHEDRMPDLSPAGYEAKADLARSFLTELNSLDEDSFDELERRCALLLRDRLESIVEDFEHGEHLRTIRNIFSPIHSVRQTFTLMPTATDEDWAAIARRLARFPQAYDSYVLTLDEGRARGIMSAPRQVSTVVGQLDEWLEARWFHDFTGAGSEALRAELQQAADAAHDAVAKMRSYLADTYLPAAADVPDAVGEEAYRRAARRSLGAFIDPHEAYEWGWSEFRRIDVEIRELAAKLLPGSTPVECMRHLDEHGARIEGVEEVRVALQQMMDQAIVDLDGTHFDIAEPIKHVEAMIAPAGSAAAPYYTRPSLDFSRPGRTWLPTQGRTAFPLYDLVSTWYHEGIPGHHLQLAQWVHVAPQLSVFQTSIGSSSAVTEGWALYSERLMDELGFLDDEARMGYLDAQMMRAVRVIIDIGMHLELDIPADSPIAPGGKWTPELAEEFFAAHSGRPADFIASEIIRYLGWPGQAISYKLGERAWLAGRERARQARGEAFDLKAWHMAALSLGALGLDALEDELAAL